MPDPKSTGSRVIFDKEYVGFEDVYDLERDISEVLDPRHNALAKIVPSEFMGTMRVTITYEKSEDDPISTEN